jgi:hypothetical protein
MEQTMRTESRSLSKAIYMILRYAAHDSNSEQNKLTDILTEIKYHRQQVTLVRSEKDTMESVLGMKIADTKKSVMNDAARVRHDMEKSRKT